MKFRRFFLVGISIALLCCSGCKKDNSIPTDLEPEVVEMKSICELATLECYYHNVAKLEEKDAEGILLWKKDKKFWVEYSGVVKIGIDTSKIEIVVDGTDVKVTLPKAEVLGFRIDELNEDSFIVDKDSANITAEDEKKAFASAEEDLVNKVSKDENLLSNARDRAERLLEEYIENIGAVVDKEYNIEWNYLEE